MLAVFYTHVMSDDFTGVVPTQNRVFAGCKTEGCPVLARQPLTLGLVCIDSLPMIVHSSYKCPCNIKYLCALSSAMMFALATVADCDVEERAAHATECRNG